MPVAQPVTRETLTDIFLIAVAGASTLPSAVFPGRLFMESEELFLMCAVATGALLSAIRSKGVTWQEKVTVMLSGMGVAIFVTSAVCEYFQITSLLPFGAAMFVSGYGGHTILNKFLTWLKNAKATDFIRVLLEHYTKKGGSK